MACRFQPHSNHVVLFLIPLVLLGTACSTKPEFPSPENQFCAVIEDGRKAYTERAAINDLLDKQRQRKEVRRERDQALRTILPEGRVQGWYVQITQVPKHDSLPQLALKLPCGPALLVVAKHLPEP